MSPRIAVLDLTGARIAFGQAERVVDVIDIAIERQADGGLIAHDFGGVDVVIGHDDAGSRLNHDLADPGDSRAAVLLAVVGAPIEQVPFASGDRGVRAPDAMIMRRRFLARQLRSILRIFIHQHSCHRVHQIHASGGVMTARER